MSQVILKALILAFTISLGGFLFGFDASVISGVVSFVSLEFALNDWQTGFVVSSPTLGAIIGSFLVGPVSDYLGRKRTLILIAALYLISATLSAFAPSYELLVLARVIGGLAFASLMLAPVYIAEIAPAKLRGLMISINQLAIVLGFSAAYFANYYLLNASGASGDNPNDMAIALGINDANVWRWMLGAEVLPAFIFLLSVFSLPESPRWLILKNKIAAARNVLSKLNPGIDIETLLQDIQQNAKDKAASAWSRLQELLSPKMRLVLTIGILIGIIQQITGVNAIYFYAPSIFEQSGIGTNAAFAQAIWVGITNVVFTIIAMLCIDFIGRKPLMVIGLVGVLASMTLCAYGFYKADYQLTEASVQTLAENTKPEDINLEKLKPLIGKEYANDVDFKNALKSALGAQEYKANEGALIQAAIVMNPMIVLIGILGFVASFAISLGPVMWVLLAEIFPNHLRGVAISFVGVLNSGCSFLVQLMFPWQLSNLGSAITFLIYGAFAFIGLILVLWLLPETKGKSLEQLEDDLA